MILIIKNNKFGFIKNNIPHANKELPYNYFDGTANYAKVYINKDINILTLLIINDKIFHIFVSFYHIFNM